jgi:hypothetical protein
MMNLTYLKRLKTWILEGIFFYSFVLIILMPLVFKRFEINDFGIRVYGLFLQILGAYFTYRSLKEKTLLFQRESLFKSLKNYFKRFPVKITPINANISGQSAGLSITIPTPRVRISPQENFADLIRYIDVEIGVLNERISKENRELQNKIQNLKGLYEVSLQETTKKIKEIENKIAILNVSNMDREYFGIFVLIYGIILATVPDLASKILYLKLNDLL